MKKLRVTVNGVSYDVDVEVLEDDEAGVPASGLTAAPAPAAPRPAPAAAPAAPPPAPASRPAAAPAAASANGKSLPSPIAGIVVELKVAVGDAVKMNDPVIIIEAMKMNTNVASPVTGKVTAINVKPGEAVKQNQILMTFE